MSADGSTSVVRSYVAEQTAIGQEQPFENVRCQAAVKCQSTMAHER